MSIGLISIILLAALILMLASGIRIAFGLGFLAMVGIIIFLDVPILYQIAENAEETCSNLFLVALPLFLLMAEVVNLSGIGDDVYTAAHSWLGWLPGGLAISSIVACAGFSAVSGSSPATAATVGMVSIPEMIKRGYNRKLAVGSIAAGGTLGILIPPSINMIVVGMITEMSIGKLFIAGIIPGIILALILSLATGAAVIAKPKLATRIQGVTWGERFSSLKRVWAVLLLAICIIGSLYAGIATPTESAAIGVILSIVIALGYRKLSVTAFRGALARSIGVTSMIMFLVIGGTSLAFLMSSLGIPQHVSGIIMSLGLSKWFVMIIINIIMLIMGCVLDPMGVMVISLPTIFPIVTELGFDPVWFCVVVTINVEIGMITPPVGLNLFVLKGSVPGITMKDIIGGSIPYALILMLGLAIIMTFPGLATWLPGMMGF
ncbi:TRAP transporter large permease [Thermodesulfobacteriota bacterium]